MKVMKKIVVFLGAISLLALLACQNYIEDKPVDFKKLPVAAQAFISSAYPDVAVLYITILLGSLFCFCPSQTEKSCLDIDNSTKNS